MRILFMGTPDFAVASLRRLVEEGHTVCGVLTQPDKPRNRGHKVTFSPVKEYALSQSLPVYQPTTLRDEAALELVKGLAPVPVNFAEGDTEEGCVSFDFAESPGLLRWLADLFRGLREYVVEKDGTEMADRAIPSYAVSGLQEMAAASAAQAAEIPAFAENLTPPKEKSMQKQETPPAGNIDFAETKARADELERIDIDYEDDA